MPTTAQTIGFIGVGNMGGRMARRLVEAGFEVHAVDTDPRRVAECAATAARDIPSLCTRCDVILLSLPESRIVESVVLAQDGILRNASPGKVVVDLSTSDPSSTRSLASELHAAGVDLVDAGISGGAAAADKGTLTLMVGGPEAALERVRPVLDAFSARIHHLGPSGAGHTAKVLNNFLNGVALASTAEVMVAAKKAGLPLHELLEVINSSSGVNFATMNRFPHIVEGDYLEGGLTGYLMWKDIHLYLDLMDDLSAATLVGPATLTAFQLANSLGYRDVISNHVVDAYGDVSGGIRLHEEKN